MEVRQPMFPPGAANLALLVIAWQPLLGCSSPHAVDGASRVGPGGADLPTESPEQAGYSSTKLSALLPQLATIHSTAGIVLVGGSVIFSWGNVTDKLEVHSIRKSLLSSLYGNAVARGQIDLAQTLGNLGINDIHPPLTPRELTASVGDCIEARSGIYHDANYAPAIQVENRPPAQVPGTYWFYNNWDFNAAGAVDEQQTRSSIYDAFATQIAAPIGMQDYTAADGLYEWTTSNGREIYTTTDGKDDRPDDAVSILPAYTFRMSTRDMGRFGLLYLDNGTWNGNQVVPVSWVTASTQSYSRIPSSPYSPAGEGYGYMWWVGTGSGLFFDVDLGPGSFAAEGTGGHYVVVIPAHDMVVVNRADDAWYEEDEAARNIGPHEMGKVLAAILGAKESP